MMCLYLHTHTHTQKSKFSLKTFANKLKKAYESSDVGGKYCTMFNPMIRINLSIWKRELFIISFFFFSRSVLLL